MGRRLGWFTVDKHCNKCGILLTDLNWYKYYKKRWMNICKKCDNKRNREYYQKHKVEALLRKRKYRLEHGEEIKARSRAKTLEIKTTIINHYGKECACCGETEIKFLTIDHIEGGGTKHRKQLGGGGQRIYRWLIKNNFPEGYQVLCWNCNCAKGLYNTCPHQQ